MTIHYGELSAALETGGPLPDWWARRLRKPAPRRRPERRPREPRPRVACSTRRCHGLAKARGLCGKCLMRLYRRRASGSRDEGFRPTTREAERLWTAVLRERGLA